MIETKSEIGNESSNGQSADQQKAASLFVRCLENEGVTKIFGVPGEENEDLLFAIAESETLEFIPCRHEQGAAFIADVWGRLSGEPGVCLSTLGPGATNLITGMADANLDKAPLVAITGQGDIARMHHESHQMIDVVKMFEPVTKWNSSVKTPEVIPEVIRKAFKIARTPKPGATHIELSEDIAAAMLSDQVSPIAKSSAPATRSAESAINRTFEMIKNANYPLIMVGNGAVRNSIYNLLETISSQAKLPVVSTFMGKGAVSDKLPTSLLAVGLGFKDYVMEAFEKTDLVITVGYDIAEYSPDDWNPEGKTKVIHIDETQAEVYHSYAPEIELTGDIKLNLEQLQQKFKKEEYQAPDQDWFQPIRKRVLDDINTYTLTESDDFTVPGVLNALRDALSDDGIIISDVGAHKMWIARNFPTYCCNSCIISNGFASMGIALPGGIAASLLYPDRQVVSVMGDGGFMMNVQELETAKRLGTPYTIIVVNDNDYGLISWKQNRHRGKSAGTRIDNPDFVKLAESFGIKAYKPEDPKELKSVLENALNSNELNLIEIPIVTDVNRDLTDKLKQYWENKP